MKTAVLTKFQARSLLASELGTLRVGPWLILRDHAKAPFANWLSVRHAEDGRTGVLLRASGEALAGGRDLWLEAHEQVSAAALQGFEVVSDDATTSIFSSLPPGCSLAESTQNGGVMSPQQVVDVGISVANALHAMHARSLIHGGPRLDRVWVTSKGKAILLRDPAGPPASPWDDFGGGWLDGLDPPNSYLAPEFLDHAHPCDVGTDIYSLGCLLFRLLTGRPPVKAKSVEDAVSLHASETAPELAEAVARGEAGDPLFRVLAYAMAKTAAARFGTADQLATALQATRPFVQSRSATDAVPPAGSSQPTDSQTAASSSRRAKDSVASKPQQDQQKKSGSPTAKSSKSKRDSQEANPTQSTKPSRDAKSDQKTKPDQKTKAPQKTEDTEKAKSIAPASAEATRSKRSKEKEGAETRSRNAAKTVSSEPGQRNQPPRESVDAPQLAGDQPSAGTKIPPVVDAVREAPATPAAVPPSAGPVPPPAVVPPTVSEAPPMVDGMPATPPIELSSKPAGVSEGSPPSESDPPRRRRKKKDRRAPIILGGLCVAVLVLLIGLLVPPSQKTKPEPRRRPPVPTTIPSVTSRSPDDSGTIPTESEGVAGYELVSDDRLLFVPPYAAESETPSLELLPPGPAVILSWNVASVINTPSGQDLQSALSPDLDNLMQKVVAASKIPLDQIKRCTVALHPGADGWPEASLSIVLAEARPQKDLIELWQVAASRTSSGATIYAGDSVDGAAYYFPKTEESGVARFAVGSIQRMSEVAEAEGGAIPLARSTERLWGAASSEADMVALITPNFLFADGREMLSSVVPELVNPLKTVLIPDVAGALFTVDIVGDQCYLETRLAPSGGTSEAALLKKLRTAIDLWPQWAEDFIVTSVPDASWRLLASRLPSMMRFVSGQFRYGISGGIVIANSYLPVESVPQLSVAVVFAMNTTGQSMAVTQVNPETQLTVEEMLEQEMSVSFDQESLEFAIDAIVGAFNAELPRGVVLPPVRIIGADLELSGITQNQQVLDFEKSNVTLRSVLTDLVVGANPDKSSTAPSDSKQALIWVLAKDQAGKPEIRITTRKVAAGKYDLPREFQAPDAN
ncbi:MAG: hypothetical protein P8L85_20510 [Rubripirellula sp.]|nr:hypothetical protein [Rubripirellula sp.]